MAEKQENETLASSLEKTLEKSKGTVIAVAVVIVVIIAAIAIFATVKAKSTESGIEKFESISFALTDKADELSPEDLAARQDKAIEELSLLAAKSGIVGLRANMLIADLKFAQKKYEEARSSWLKAAEIKKSAYTAPLCYYNAAVCSEELGDNDSAISYYKSATESESAKSEDFLLLDHALFSLGRVNETAQKFEDAKSAYEKLVELHSTSSWGQLAKSRLIALKANGSIQ